MYGEELCIHCSSYGHSFYLDSSKSCQISKLEVRFKEDSDEDLRSWRRTSISLWVETTSSFHPVIMSFFFNPMIGESRNFYNHSRG